MKIFKEKFIELPKEVWKPLWNKTLTSSHPCPLTSSMVVRSHGKAFVNVSYKLDGKLIKEHKEVLFDENSPSLSSENSHCWGACVRITTPTFEWRELEIIGFG